MPRIASITKAGAPFRLLVAGSNFQSLLTVRIAGRPWTRVNLKSSTLLVLQGDRALKALFPHGVPVQITVTNPDGGSATATWTRP